MKKYEVKLKWKWLFILLIACLLVEVLVQTNAESVGNEVLEFNLEANDWIALVIGALSFASSFFLGVVALCQNRKITALNLRAVIVEEEKIYPYLIACSNRNEFQEMESTYHMDINEIVANRILEVGGKTQTELIKYQVCGSDVKELKKIKMPITLRNNSNVYVTKIKILSISAKFITELVPQMRNFDEKIYEQFGETVFIPLKPNEEVIFDFSLVVDKEITTDELNMAIEQIIFRFEIHTLNHFCNQEIAMNFGDNYTYNYCELQNK